MKSFYNKLNVIITAFFVLGILFSAYHLYFLPSALERASGRVDLSVIKEIAPALHQTYFIVGLTLFLGLGSIILALYLLNFSKVSEKIVYVEKTTSEKLEAEQKIEREKQEDLSKQVEKIQALAKDIKEPKLKCEKVFSSLCMKIEASQGILYAVTKERNKKFIDLFAAFANNLPENKQVRYEFGEGLAGQAAKDKKKINIKDIPEGYITIISGLGAASPNHLAIIPIMEKGEIKYVAEIASFKEISISDENLIAAALQLQDESKMTNKKNASLRKTDV